jgi:hypothetical protein
MTFLQRYLCIYNYLGGLVFEVVLLSSSAFSPMMPPLLQTFLVFLQNGFGAHPASYRMGSRRFLLVVKWPGSEADHSPPSSAEVKNAWSYSSTPYYVFMEWCLVKHRHNFTFTCCGIAFSDVTVFSDVFSILKSSSL